MEKLLKSYDLHKNGLRIILNTFFLIYMCIYKSLFLLNETSPLNFKTST